MFGVKKFDEKWLFFSKDPYYVISKIERFILSVFYTF